MALKVSDSRSVLGCDEEYPDWCMALSPLLGQELDLLPTVTVDDSQAMVELTERQNGGEKTPVVCQTYKGELKLSIYINCGLLTVHIIEAKNLQSGYSQDCDSYVRVSILPDKIRKSKCKTCVVNHCNTPVFDEKFSFELLKSDSSKRLLISAWHRTPKKASEFLGCMSFGIKHILQRAEGIHGWYHLLSELLGQRKHLQSKEATKSWPAPNEPSPRHTESRQRTPDKKCRERTTESCDGSPSTIRSTFTLDLQKTSSSCGLMLTAGIPVQVCAVDPGSAAHSAGVRPGDVILSVNNHCVHRCTSQTVANLLRNCEGCVTLHIGCSSSRKVKDLPSRNQRSAVCPNSKSPKLNTSSPASGTIADVSGCGSSKTMQNVGLPSWSSAAETVAMAKAHSNSSSHSDYGSLGVPV